MTQATKKQYPGAITVEDYGKDEYLDGAQMQYAVHGKSYTLAFFAEKEDAHLFAKAKSAGTPAEVEARVKEARRDALEEAARLREAIEMARECIDDKDVIGARQTLTIALGETQ
jgi:hypothetical protein